MRTLVKICGVRTIDAAQAAVRHGADFIGLNFVPASKRFIDFDNALKIAEAVRGKAKIAGVFQNQKSDDINSIADKLGLDFVQLHGSEDHEFAKKIKTRIVKSLSAESKDLDEMIKNYPAEYFLLDRKIQGQGEMVDQKIAKLFAKDYKVFLAGGLTPENVFETVRKVRPFAVDVAGGVETDGKQDLEKIKLFIKRAKGVSL
jgi:phosphoribosylanthranilate isomerase